MDDPEQIKLHLCFIALSLICYGYLEEEMSRLGGLSSYYNGHVRH
jgi:hypothetical protein